MGSLNKIMFKFILLISLACLLSPASVVTWKEGQPYDVVPCGSDGEPGLTFEELESCQLPSVTTREQFDKIDANGDGIITNEEAKEFFGVESFTINGNEVK